MDKYNINSPDWARGLIRTVKILNNLYGVKEVKKLSRPYFEMKVVKVKKKKEYSNQIIIGGRKYTLCKEEYLHKEKGNYVNGENLDKIKFPCFCSYSNENEKGIGFLSVNGSYYYIANINFQKRVQEDIDGYNHDLKAFVIKNNVHILKGKVIIYEEE